MNLAEAIARRELAVSCYQTASICVMHLRDLGLSPVALELTTWRGIQHACHNEITRCENSITSSVNRARSIIERVHDDSDQNERERARASRHDHRDYEEGQEDSWPVCHTCGANSCGCGWLDPK